jgi:hypothetical protein
VRSELIGHLGKHTERSARPDKDPDANQCRTAECDADGNPDNQKHQDGREARKAQPNAVHYEIRLRPKTNEHHRGFKTRDARRWLLDGMKVRVTIRFRGREIDYPELALEDLREIAQDLVDIAAVEQAPIIEGKTMTMVLNPVKPVKKKSVEEPQKEPAE